MFHRPAFAVVALVAMLAPAVALAHAKLASSTPAANGTVAAPTRIELVFSEKLAPQFSGIDLVMTGMPGMKSHGPMKMSGLKTDVGPDGKTLVAVSPRPLPAGTYRVDYHVVSADTHRIKGSYNFTVK